MSRIETTSKNPIAASNFVSLPILVIDRFLDSRYFFTLSLYALFQFVIFCTRHLSFLIPLNFSLKNSDARHRTEATCVSEHYVWYTRWLSYKFERFTGCCLFKYKEPVVRATYIDLFVCSKIEAMSKYGNSSTKHGGVEETLTACAILIREA